MNCPVCAATLDQDFGVVACSQCQSLLFIDMEGGVQVSETSASPPGTQTDTQTDSQIASTKVSSAAIENYFENSQGLDPLPADTLPTNTLPSGQFQPEDLALDPVPPDPALPMDPLPAMPETSGFADVLEFANSERTSQGPLSYTIVIEGIDTKDVRENLKDALLDPKFQWDLREIMNKLEDGRIELKDLNPAKASVLVHRLRDLPLTVRWRQNVY